MYLYITYCCMLYFGNYITIHVYFCLKKYLYMKVEKDPYRYPYENRPIHLS